MASAELRSFEIDLHKYRVLLGANTRIDYDQNSFYYKINLFSVFRCCALINKHELCPRQYRCYP